MLLEEIFAIIVFLMLAFVCFKTFGAFILVFYLMGALIYFEFSLTSLFFTALFIFSMLDEILQFHVG